MAELGAWDRSLERVVWFVQFWRMMKTGFQDRNHVYSVEVLYFGSAMRHILIGEAVEPVYVSRLRRKLVISRKSHYTNAVFFRRTL